MTIKYSNTRLSGIGSQPEGQHTRYEYFGCGVCLQGTRPEACLLMCSCIAPEPLFKFWIFKSSMSTGGSIVLQRLVLSLLRTTSPTTSTLNPPSSSAYFLPGVRTRFVRFFVVPSAQLMLMLYKVRFLETFLRHENAQVLSHGRSRKGDVARVAPSSSF
jgi:hypothetical protein